MQRQGLETHIHVVNKHSYESRESEKHNVYLLMLINEALLGHWVGMALMPQFYSTRTLSLLMLPKDWFGNILSVNQIKGKTKVKSKVDASAKAPHRQGL